ncbi:N-acetyltransferase [Mesobacillus boroniphilus]|uniref:N-acetyltransferase n=1 Tax=Mesobacillus boroniphilus TaxID=308892 RepID=A0A944CNF0_9BACI|nr:GNAT family protein [Mesobacillus boroniphilus]MBS8265682.1 N-acetyltransferase [Mesobacillus boroniphilus]
MEKNKQVFIRPLNEQDIEASLDMQRRNREFFEKYSMTRSDDFYTKQAQAKRIRQQKEDRSNDAGYSFGIFKKKGDELIGAISLFQILRDDLQSAFIGYFLDKDHNGKGYATEAVELIVDFAFCELKLHRIEAGVMPHNLASIRVLEKAGFHKEGIARKNVKINGKWEDHQVLAIINSGDLD